MSRHDALPMPSEHRGVLRALLGAEWAAGIYGLKLFIGCVAIATFMMGAVWALGGGLSSMLARGGSTFLGGDVAVTMTNVPLSEDVRDQLASLGRLSEAAELRSSAKVEDTRVPVEVKGVDDAYPLYGNAVLESGRDIGAVLGGAGPRPAAIVEPSLLIRTDGKVGDTLRLGDNEFVIADVLSLEPDRLSAGRFMIGPRVLVHLDVLLNSDLIQRGSIVEYRYRLRQDARAPADLIAAVRDMRPDTGWELETPDEAGDRVLRTVERTTTFLGIAGIVAFAIGLSGAWAAAKAWIRRRSRTIALYRLSGATPGMVFALHASILAIASAAGMIVGLGASLVVASPLLDFITAQLHVAWLVGDVAEQIAMVAVILLVGLLGTGLLALSGAVRVAPGAAMRSGEAPLHTDPRHAFAAGVFLVLAIAGAAFSLPVPKQAVLATLGFMTAMAMLALTAALLSRFISGLSPRGFFGTVVCQSLGSPGHTATRTVAIGVGIVGITAIVAAQSSLNRALIQELPERVPDLVLIDVQPAQVNDIRNRIEEDPSLGGLQADPFMRMTITAINGVPAADALRRSDKSWVIEGDRSFSWTAKSTGAELLQGEWWDEGYAGPPLVSPEEDMMEAFDLKVGDTVTYSVLGRVFTSKVVNIRKEYHRTFRPEYLMMASPQPFSDAPHTWIMSLQGNSVGAIDRLIRSLSKTHPNVTSIDIRPIVEQVGSVIKGTTAASILIAVLLVIAGALSVAALVASDVDARRREALVFSLVGASRREIALVRLTEAAAIGVVAATLGGVVGVIGGYFVVVEGLRIAWSPSFAVFLLPLALGVAASIVAGIVGGLGAAPSGRGQMVRQLTA